MTSKMIPVRTEMLQKNAMVTDEENLPKLER